MTQLIRQPLPIRLTHWLNVALLAVMIGSGLQIFNAHPTLYAADTSREDRTVLTLPGPVEGQPGRHEMTLLGLHVNTGPIAIEEFPRPVTVGGWLAGARRWHLGIMWLFMLNGLLYVLYQFTSGQARHRFMRREDWSGIPQVIRHYLFRAPLPEGDGYNPLQRLTYTGIVLFFGPLVVLTGLAMSPQWDAWFPWYVDLFGGRQFARTWHFLLMAGLVAFTAAHLVLVAMAGWPTFWSMIAGGPRPKPEAAHE
jgi:thiosulfate reductase cytochrome b subunit